MSASYAVALAALALAFVFGREATAFPEQAARLPHLLVWLVAGLAVMLALEEFIKWRRRRSTPTEAPKADAASEAPAEPHPIEWTALLPFLAGVFAYVFLMPYLGYLVATPVFIAAVLLVARTLRPVTSVVCALTITGVLWVIFIWLLHLPIPLMPQLA